MKKYLIFAVLLLTALFISHSLQAQRDRYTFTASIDAGNQKVTLDVIMYNMQFGSTFYNTKDSVKVDECPHSASLTIGSFTPDLLKVIAANKKINVALTIKDQYGAAPSYRKLEFKNALFQVNEYGTRPGNSSNEGSVSILLQYKTLFIDGTEIKF